TDLVLLLGFLLVLEFNQAHTAIPYGLTGGQFAFGLPLQDCKGAAVHHARELRMHAFESSEVSAPECTHIVRAMCIGRSGRRAQFRIITKQAKQWLHVAGVFDRLQCPHERIGWEIDADHAMSAPRDSTKSFDGLEANLC